MALIAATALRTWGIGDPFVHSLDSAFQESLALSHLKYGLSVTRGLATSAVLDGKAIHHAAHPPLLQLIYAGLYSIFGVHEYVSRSVSIFAVLVTMICLWVVLMKAGTRRAAFVATLALAILPFSVRLSRTTNYEPLSLAFISLILVGYMWRDRKWGVALMCAVAVIGGLFEWTVYLALPTLIFAAGYGDKSLKLNNLKPIFLPSIIAAITLIILLSYQYNAVGHIPVLEHAKVRSNPSAIQGMTLQDAFKTPKDVGLAFVLFFWGFVLWMRKFKENIDMGKVILYFLFMPIFFYCLAIQLLFSHPIAFYYLAPVYAIFIGIVAERLKLPWLLLIMTFLFGSFAMRDCDVLKEQNPFYSDLAKLITQNGSLNNYYVFDSSAVGYLRYYHGIETIYPLGGNEPSLSELVSNSKVRYFILDTTHPEVGYVKKAVAGMTGLTLKWRFAQTEVWERSSGDSSVHLTNELGNATLPPPGEFWETPQAEMLEAGGRARFGIFHHARLSGFSTIIFKGVPSGKLFKATVWMDPAVCNPPKTDGVGYSVVIKGGDWKRAANGVIKPGNNSCDSKLVEIGIDGASPKVDIELTVSPLGSASFDRFFWEDPRIELKEE